MFRLFIRRVRFGKYIVCGWVVQELLLLAESKLCSKVILGYPHIGDIHLNECQRSGKSEANGYVYVL